MKEECFFERRTSYEKLWIREFFLYYTSFSSVGVGFSSMDGGGGALATFSYFFRVLFQKAI